jgi:hypothetical protein
VWLQVNAGHKEVVGHWDPVHNKAVQAVQAGQAAQQENQWLCESISAVAMASEPECRPIDRNMLGCT